MSEPPGKRQKVSTVELTEIEQPQEEKIVIPKIIHFVWAGGEKQMPEINKQRVLEWARKNSDFQVYIWVDYQSSMAGSSYTEKKQKVQEHYKDLLTEVKIHLKDVREDLLSIISGDTTKASQVQDVFNYEIGRLRPNYGASSDLLRYSFLYNFGGAYFDSDILVGDSKLSDSVDFHGESSRHTMQVIYVDPKSQNQKMSIGNDAFIVTKNNPAMLAILKNALDRYKFSYLDQEDKLIAIDGYDVRERIKQDTPLRTGPRALDQIILKSTHKFDIDGKKDQFEIGNVLDEYEGSSILPIPEECRKTVSNECEWVGKPIPMTLSKEVFLNKIIESSVFEWKELNMLRLNDHFYNFYEIYQPEVFPLEQFLNDLIAILGVEKLDISSNKYVQEIKSLKNYIKQNDDSTYEKDSDGNYVVQYPKKCPMSITNIISRVQDQQELEDNSKCITDAKVLLEKHTKQELTVNTSKPKY